METSSNNPITPEQIDKFLTKKKITKKKHPGILQEWFKFSSRAYKNSPDDGFALVPNLDDVKRSEDLTEEKMVLLDEFLSQRQEDKSLPQGETLLLSYHQLWLALRNHLKGQS